jgi:energy-coupling factor transporter ATP-binding protein EcfA2
MEIKNISYQYKNKKGIFNISFTANGNIVSFIGKNGSGKSTLLEVLAGLRTPKEGEIVISNFTITKDSNIDLNDLRFKVGFMSDTNEDEFLGITIEEDFALKLKFYNFNEEKIEERIKASLKMVGLEENILDKKIEELSTGEARRVSLAKTLLLNPEIIILDNPTFTLDSESKQNLIKLLKLLKRRYKKTIVIASNDIEFIHKVTDYIYVLDHGKIILEGNKYEIFKEEKKLKKNNIISPYIIRIPNKVLEEKGLKIGYRDEINDLIKDIYRYVK